MCIFPLIFWALWFPILSWDFPKLLEQLFSVHCFSQSNICGSQLFLWNNLESWTLNVIWRHFTENSLLRTFLGFWCPFSTCFSKQVFLVSTNATLSTYGGKGGVEQEHRGRGLVLKLVYTSTCFYLDLVYLGWQRGGNYRGAEVHLLQPLMTW